MVKAGLPPRILLYVIGGMIALSGLFAVCSFIRWEQQSRRKGYHYTKRENVEWILDCWVFTFLQLFFLLHALLLIVVVVVLLSELVLHLFGPEDENNPIVAPTLG